MSRQPATLLQLPNLIIKGRYYPILSSSDGEPVKVDYECIELDFIIQVNGKMANFQNSFIISKQFENGTEYTLEDFGEWYLLVRILMSLWYYLSEDVKHEHQMQESNSIIKRWINILREDEMECPNLTQTVWFHGWNSFGGSTNPGTESMKTAIN